MLVWVSAQCGCAHALRKEKDVVRVIDSWWWHSRRESRKESVGKEKGKEKKVEKWFEGKERLFAFV